MHCKKKDFCWWTFSPCLVWLSEIRKSQSFLVGLWGYFLFFSSKHGEYKAIKKKKENIWQMENLKSFLWHHFCFDSKRFLYLKQLACRKSKKKCRDWRNALNPESAGKGAWHLSELCNQALGGTDKIFRSMSVHKFLANPHWGTEIFSAAEGAVYPMYPVSQKRTRCFSGDEPSRCSRVSLWEPSCSKKPSLWLMGANPVCHNRNRASSLWFIPLSKWNRSFPSPVGNGGEVWSWARLLTSSQANLFT